MAEQTFKSPGFFEREIEVIKRPLVKNTATPVGVIGPAVRGPALVPTTVYSQEEFVRIFGAPHRKMLGGHAASEFFRNDGRALTYCRTLGTGSWTGTAIEKAGFKLVSKAGDAGVYGISDKKYGAVHFIAAQHAVANAEFLGLGIFNDNRSHTTDANNAAPLAGNMPDGIVELVRAMIFTHKNNTLFVSTLNEPDVVTADVVAADTSKVILTIKDNDDTVVNTFTVSLDPAASDYISNVLNTDPLSFDEKGHLLYAHFPVDKEVAEVGTRKVAVLHDALAGVDEDGYGDFSSRFTTPETPKFISQPFGQKEYDLFHFESLDDGAYASDKYKISISNLRASTDPTYDFGTFTVSVRDLRDTDESPIIYETFTNCTLDPNAVSFVANVIGDQKLFYSYETDEDERRLVREGSFPNVSTRIRVVMSDDVLSGEVPQTAMPFGYRGVPALLLNDKGVDRAADGSSTNHVDGRGLTNENLEYSVLPPLPYRFKVTKGSIQEGTAYNQEFTGDASGSEAVDLNLHWGLMPTRVTDINNANSGTVFNELLSNYTKYLGKNSTVVSSALADSHNNNKFSLAKVVLKTPLDSSNKADVRVSAISGTINDVFKDAVYIRNADADSSLYDAATHTVNFADGSSKDPLSGEDQTQEPQSVRMSLAKLLAEDAVKFNKYNLAIKFTAPFHGGFDGLNILDSDSYYMTDLGLSSDGGNGVDGLAGKASSLGFESGIRKTVVDTTESTEAQDKTQLMQGAGDDNNLVFATKTAVRVMTDELVVNHNVLVLPNVRDEVITDMVKSRIESYGKALYLMDIPFYNHSNERLYVDEKGKSDDRPDVDATSLKFDSREVNSSYVASYFPDVMVLDSSDSDEGAVNSRRSIKVPSSIVALGALAKTDSISQPWFAPAGFSRGSLETITSTDVRLNAADRDTLYEARINPIANFPNKQFVIFGQKTSQLARTALDRVNVRRLVLEVKRQIGLIAQRLLFEQNNKATRDRFIASASSRLATIQLGQGIEDFRVVMDSTNNSAEDVDNNRLNGKIIIVPTRAVEFIAIDFVITNAGVEFP